MATEKKPVRGEAVKEGSSVYWALFGGFFAVIMTIICQILGAGRLFQKERKAKMNGGWAVGMEKGLVVWPNF